MHRLRALVIALVALAFSATGLSAASAGPVSSRPPEILSLSPAASTTPGHADEVRVMGTYRCWGPSEAMHLWVSVKQGGPNPTMEGSSRTVDAWYDTNVSQDVAVRCNGAWQTTMVTLGRQAFANYPSDSWEAPPTRPLGYLHNGKAWLQFCLVPPDQNVLLASQSRWVNVTGAGLR